MIKNNRIVIIGAGAVGCSYAYALLQQGLTGEIVLIDVNEEKAAGEAGDLRDAVPFAPVPVTIRSGGYEDCSEAELVVITAGLAQKPGETRLDLLTKNADIFERIVTEVMAHGFNGIFLAATNPVDILTDITQQVSGLPAERVIGSGTVLDSARLQSVVSACFHIDSRDVHAWIIGEHGDTSLPVWSSAFAGMKDIRTMAAEEGQQLDSIFQRVQSAAYEIIQQKGATHFGIGMSLARITRAIVHDENAVLPVSARLNGEYGENGIYIGVPAVIGRTGIRSVMDLPLDETETQQFAHSAQTLRESKQTLSY
ncbi:L-lactate dehydrogenase [Salibacterium qingdaonense]|uniref:L-lactate dehydrogenase n=1 Tax=Salibacterium qingdaonense TaxID=266892 RepID=A0A1I4MG10_9BACI|nr:L-lactate dehydrogenase [Salibacterium qingdaonense]SFM01927.1 L-lactate dehydrogenase [Salibacterium qingdaonense]